VLCFITTHPHIFHFPNFFDFELLEAIYAMGVPKFFRWLSERYPRINQVLDDASDAPDIDHLYFDMNGILHMCTHPNDDELTPRMSDEQIMQNIEDHLDRCISEIVRPKRSIYFAVDGVAPRAKLNQQRGRRFRAGRLR
jgi:5'-3' exoribonuclease 1